MVVGNGLISNAFRTAYAQSKSVCIYAAGVSNSMCVKISEFERERELLNLVLNKSKDLDCFVYFSSCSVLDPEHQLTPYVLHKLSMEKIVACHSRHLIFRVPIVASKSSNPYTLLNFLNARIVSGQPFQVWAKSYRNIIDIDDLVNIAKFLINDNSMRQMIINIANPVNYSVIDIVRKIEIIAEKKAVYELIECGSEYKIDVSVIKRFIGNSFDALGCNYLENVIGKYYGKVD